MTALARPGDPASEPISYHDARSAGLFREMEADPSIFLIGGVITIPGVNPETPISEKFPGRVVWNSIAEFSSMSMGVGAAMSGLKPLVPIGTGTFMFYGWPAIAVEAPNIRYVTGGTVQAPVVFHIMTGIRRGIGTDHEHTPQAMLQQIPGLRIYAPGTPAEIDGVWHAAFKSGDPTLVVDHNSNAGLTGVVPATPLDPDIPYFLRQGSDGLIVAHSYMVQLALQSAELLSRQGVEIAVLSMPLLNPVPLQQVLEISGRYQHIVFVDEARSAGSTASNLMAQLFDAGSTARARLVTTLATPSPNAVQLGDAIVPTVDRITQAMNDALGRAN